MKRRLPGLAALVGFVLLAVGPAGTNVSTAADVTPTVSVTPTTGVTDGQAVTVTIHTADSVPVYEADARLCRAGVDYQGSTDIRPNADFQLDGPNCPGSSHAISSSSDYAVADANTQSNAPTPEGESFLYRMGTGVSSWSDAGGTAQTLTCDETHQCALVVEVEFSPGSGQPAQWKPYVTTISFGTSDPIAGCGGPANGVVGSGGSDRMSDAWVAWTLGACARQGAHGAPTRASFVGEGNAVTQFGAGALDLAYTAGGYDKDMGLVPAAAPQRPAVAIPVALNAAVIALGGGTTQSGHKVPFKDIKVTYSEAAGIIGGGVAGAGPYDQAIRDRNPELSSQVFDNSAGFLVGAYADAEASSWYATRLFKDLVPDAWKVPDASTFGDARGLSRGIDASLALAQPSFAQALSLLSGQPALRKGLIGPNANTSGGVWVLTDLAVATSLGLTPVQLSSSPDSGFVAPTADTLRSALPSMTADDQGILVSDPTKTPAGAYPLTFVEYALAPAEPLLADDCTPRTDSQKLLTDWLTYITGDGQAKLPPGLVPLPDDLKAQAAAAIAKVGASPVTGDCATAASAADANVASAADSSPAAAAPAPAASAPVASLAGSGFNYPLSPVAAAVPAVTPVVSASPGDQTANLAVKQAAIPRFAGRRASSWAGPVLALLVIVGLTSLALFRTSRAG